MFSFFSLVAPYSAVLVMFFENVSEFMFKTNVTSQARRMHFSEKAWEITRQFRCMRNTFYHHKRLAETLTALFIR